MAGRAAQGRAAAPSGRSTPGSDRKDQPARAGASTEAISTPRLPRLGFASLERPDRLVAVRRRDRHPDPRAGPVGVALVVERDRHLDEAVARAAARRRTCAGSGPARAACSSRGRACAASPRIQPPCTKVSLPSGRTSLIVACRSTFGRRRADPEAHRAGAEHRRVLRQRLGHVGDRGARRGAASSGSRASRSRGRRPAPVLPVKLVGGGARRRPR